MTNHNTGIPLVIRYDDRGRPNGFREEVNIAVSSVSATTYYGIEAVTGVDIDDLTSSGYPEGYTLQVGPSSNVIAVSSLIFPIEDDPGKLRVLNPLGTSVTNASALRWDYGLEQLNVVGDVSAQKYYGSSILLNTTMPSDYAAVLGEVYFDTDAQTLSIQTGADTTLQVGQEQVIHVRNNGALISNGSVVYVSGVQGTGAAKLLIGKASATIAEEVQNIIGIATQDIPNNTDGFITVFGMVNEVNTSLYPVGTRLYLSTSAGLYTSAQPEAPNHAINLGVVVRQHANQGKIFVKVDPGYDITDLHDVLLNGIQSGDVLRWNGTLFAPSAFDHGLLAGRTDDDHTQYVFKSPAGASRNTIQPTADVPALTLQAGLSNTGRILEVKDSLTQTVAYVTIDGTIVTDGGLTVGGTKSFLIDHPTKEGMKLQYSCLEGPENGVYVRGRTESDVIDLPDYWLGLVHENSITVTLTPVGSSQSDLFVANIADNKVYLARESDQPINCFYTVYATRKDLPKLIVEF